MLDLHTHHGRKAPFAQLLGDHCDQVLGLLFGAADVRVARDAKGPGALHFHSSKHLGQMVPHHFFERYEVQRLFKRHPASAVGGHFDPGKMLGALLRMAQQHGQRQAQVRDERKRMAGIDGQRRQHRKDLFLEITGQVAALRLVELLVVEHLHAGLAGQGRTQLLAPEAVHAVVHGPERLPDQAELLGGRAAVGRELTHPGCFLSFEAAVALAEKLVEVGRGDGQKAHALQQGDARIERLKEHAPVEVDPAQLPVEVQARIVQWTARRHRTGTGGLRHGKQRKVRRSAVGAGRLGSNACCRAGHPRSSG